MTKSIKIYSFLTLLAALLVSCSVSAQTNQMSRLLISYNDRYFMTENGDPFFWLGDTAWLLFTKLNRQEAARYLEDRQQKGFNVVQVMVLPSVESVNTYGDSALIHQNVATPRLTEGSSFKKPEEYDYWDHIDYIVDLAAKKVFIWPWFAYGEKM